MLKTTHYSKFYYRFPGVAIRLDTASVYSTKCTCIQRLAGRCKHIACLLYLLEEVGQGEKPKLMETPTDVGCYWNKGAISNKNPGPIGMLVYVTVIFKTL